MKKPPSERAKKPPVLAYSAELEPPTGLDPSVYSVTVLVDRRDGAPLSAAELEQLRALYPQATKKPAKAKTRAA